MSGDFRFDFSKKSKGKKAVKPVPENLDENAKEYRERARAERKRFVDATDTEFWLCLCFPSPAEMARWRERFGFGENHRIYAYRDIEKLLAPYKPAKSSAVAFGAGVGFSKERISQYRKQGLSDERISKLWQDTLKMRALMKKRKEQGVSDLEAGVSQSWKNAQARRDRAFDKRFNDEWNRYRSAGWKR